MKLKKIIFAVLAFVMVFALASCAAEPPYIGEDGYWYINGEKTDTLATGIKGDNGKDGEAGEKGEATTVLSCTLKSSAGLVDTYEIVFSDGSVTTFEVTNGANGAPASQVIKDSAGNILNYNQIASYINATKTITKTAATVAKNSTIKLDYSPSVKDNVRIFFSASLDNLTGSSILIGHGYQIEGGSWFEITSSEVNMYSGAEAKKTSLGKHGATVSDFINVVIDISDGKATITMMSATASSNSKDKMFKYTNIADWQGAAGDIFVTPSLSLSDVTLHFTCDDYAKNVWVIGDNTSSVIAENAWTKYLYDGGYDNALMIGNPTMSPADALDEFNHALTLGTPTHVLWNAGLYANDAAYQTATESFLAVCEANGIVPILTILPSMADYDHTAQNEWVKASGKRYVNLARAVGAVDDAEWFAGGSPKANT